MYFDDSYCKRITNSKFFVTRDGQVLYEKDGTLKESGTFKDGSGYKCVMIYDNTETWRNRKQKKIHRLVAEFFLEKPSDEKTEVDHIDGNKLNNCAENLEWVTHKENINRAIRNGFKIGESCNKECYQFDLKGNFIKKYKSISEAARQTGVRRTNISSCCTGRNKTAGGYKWCTKEGEYYLL